MATRTTPDEVSAVIGTTLTDEQIQVWIDVANVLVTANVTCGLSAAVLAEIERQLAAHLISLLPTAGARSLPVKSERLGEAEVTYVTSAFVGGALKSTIYGQTALALDSCGGRAKMGKKAISITAITSFE